MKTIKMILLLALVLAPRIAAGQTLDRFLYGAVAIDDKRMVGGCTTCCAQIPFLGYRCGQCCVQNLCDQNWNRLKNFLHLTNPTLSAVDFEVHVYDPSGAPGGFITGTIPPGGMASGDVDNVFAESTEVQLVVSASGPLEGVLETVKQDPPLTGDPEVIFTRGVDMPLVNTTSTRWRSSLVLNDESRDTHAVLYILNPTDLPASGQVRFTRGGQASGQYNVNWEGCRTFDLNAKGFEAVDLLEFDPTSTGTFSGFVEVDTGQAIELGQDCASLDALAGSVVAVILTRAGEDLDLDTGCPPAQTDFAEPVYGEIPYPQGLRFP